MNTRAEAALAGLLEEAAQSMQRLAGGMAVCTFSRAGVPVPGIKYAEGRWAALRETQRKAAADEDLAGTAARVASVWEAALRRGREANSGKDWIAYYTGGVDALAEFNELVTGGSPSGAQRLARRP